MAICEYCGAEYKQRQNRSRFCSRKCQIRGYYQDNKKSPAIIKNCAWCGNEFEAKHNRIKYCSAYCSEKSADQQRAINAEKCKAKRQPKKCVYCGEEFIPNSNKQMFCSKSCSSKHNRKRKPKNYDPKEKRSPRIYGYKKNEGVEVPKPKPKQIQKLSPASQRWATMPWLDLTKELIKFGLTYKESQIMAKNNTLPKEFGHKKRGRKKKEEDAE